MREAVAFRQGLLEGHCGQGKCGKEQDGAGFVTPETKASRQTPKTP